MDKSLTWPDVSIDNFGHKIADHFNEWFFEFIGKIVNPLKLMMNLLSQEHCRLCSYQRSIEYHPEHFKQFCTFLIWACGLSYSDPSVFQRIWGNPRVPSLHNRKRTFPIHRISEFEWVITIIYGFPYCDDFLFGLGVQWRKRGKF
jgi:hypothetical protein